MAWLVSEEQLDEQQKHFYWNQDINAQNLWIKGFPGSGKSVLLAYTVKRIQKNHPNASLVLVVFTHSLIAMFEAAFAEIGIVLDVVTYYNFMDRGKNYDYILCDEVQDLTPRVLENLKSHGKHVIVAGDENQSIYEKDPRYKENVVDATKIDSYIGSTSFELKVIHRLSKDIIDAVQAFMPNMRIFNGLTDPGHASTQIRLGNAQNRDEEVKYIMKEAGKAVKQGYTAGVLIPRQNGILDFVNKALVAEGKPIWTPQVNKWGDIDYNKMNTYLKQQGIPLKYVGNKFGSFSANDRKVILMTYHSSKGLDFEKVFLPFLDNNFEITPKESLSKTVFMVGMTRSRGDLYMTYSGELHRYPSSFKRVCHEVDIHSNISDNTASATNAYGF